MRIDFLPANVPDPHQVEDVAADGLSGIEDLGSGFRFTLCGEVTVEGAPARVVVARVIVPASALPGILFAAASHIGLALVRAPKFIRWTVH